MIVDNSTSSQTVHSSNQMDKNDICYRTNEDLINAKNTWEEKNRNRGNERVAIKTIKTIMIIIRLYVVTG